MIILASGSPRRSEILKREQIEFEVQVPSTEEIFDGNQPIEMQAMEVAKEKALVIHEIEPNKTILAADTIVVYNNQIFGKPKDETDAYQMLHSLNGKLHRVITAFCVIKDGQFYTDYDETDVQFHQVTDEAIRAYINTKEPLSRAGAYAIQEQGAFLVKEYHGDFDTVVGLPIQKIKTYL